MCNHPRDGGICNQESAISAVRTLILPCPWVCFSPQIHHSLQAHERALQCALGLGRGRKKSLTAQLPRFIPQHPREHSEAITAGTILSQRDSFAQSLPASMDNTALERPSQRKAFSHHSFMAFTATIHSNSQWLQKEIK